MISISRIIPHLEACYKFAAELVTRPHRPERSADDFSVYTGYYKTSASALDSASPAPYHTPRIVSLQTGTAAGQPTFGSSAEPSQFRVAGGAAARL